MSSKSVKRLNQEFAPDHYKLHLAPNRDDMTFSGTVIITGKKSGRPSQRLTFHQKDLKISKVHVTKHDKAGDHEIEIDRINAHGAFDEVRLHAKHMLYPARYTIRLEFTGKVTRPMNGMYPCFFEHDKKQKVLIATQFESHHAREVFPCVDEPEAKATFELSLTTPTGEAVLSNTPIKKQKTVGEFLETIFEVTPKMSTYLLAFVYGEIGYKEATTKNGVLVRAYATPENVDFTDFALETAVRCLEFYDSYFAIDYPLAKCDLIALPDFASGAMENWGCITFREQTMLVDPENSTLGTKQYVAMVVAHELAHQWFGNLVTMRWWTDLWLNEGFASWIEYLAVDHLFPEWEMWTQFVVDEQQQALKLDGLEHTHPIEVAVNHPDEIRTIFDAISYSKGASVIHMLHEFLGPDVFRDGLRHYLNRHAHGNTDTVDLWQALEEISGKPVKDFMHAWTSQSGHPLVSANVDGFDVSLSQARFFINPKHGKTDELLWPVPLLANAEVEDFTTKEVSLKYHHNEVFKLNKGQSGFYRTTYNSSHLQKLGEAVKRGKLTPADRLGVLSDLFEAAKAGHADTADALTFLENFSQEDNYAVWDVISSSLGSLRMAMADEDLREQMKPFGRRLVSVQLERLGWDRIDDESHFDRLLRPIIIGLAASSDETWVVDRCKQLFKEAHYTDDIAPDLRSSASSKDVKRGMVDPDLRGAVFGTVARLGGKEEFEKLVKLHNESNLSEERTTLVAAITGFEQPELIKKALAMIDTDDVRLQDVAYWIAYSFLNRHAKDLTWQWMKDHWVWLQKNLGTDLSFYRMPIYVARVFSHGNFMQEYVDFFEPKLSPALDRPYKQGIEMIQWQTAWRKKALAEVKTYFKNK